MYTWWLLAAPLILFCSMFYVFSGSLTILTVLRLLQADAGGREHLHPHLPLCVATRVRPHPAILPPPLPGRPSAFHHGPAVLTRLQGHHTDTQRSKVLLLSSYFFFPLFPRVKVWHFVQASSGCFHPLHLPLWRASFTVLSRFHPSISLCLALSLLPSTVFFPDSYNCFIVSFNCLKLLASVICSYFSCSGVFHCIYSPHYRKVVCTVQSVYIFFSHTFYLFIHCSYLYSSGKPLPGGCGWRNSGGARRPPTVPSSSRLHSGTHSAPQQVGSANREAGQVQQKLMFTEWRHSWI